MTRSEFDSIILDMIKSLLVCCCIWLAACSKTSDIRGNWAKSTDGKTYLIVDDDNGGGCGPIYLDGRKWKHPIGKAGEITAGKHTVHCGLPPKSPEYSQGIDFQVQDGVVYRFNYWGP
jgi:hypothetical protein